MDILVFRTNASERHLSRISQCLDNMAGIDSWDIDLEDVDRVLRVKTATISAGLIEQLLQDRGCECMELID